MLIKLSLMLGLVLALLGGGWTLTDWDVPFDADVDVETGEPLPTPTKSLVDSPSAEWYAQCDGFVRTFVGVRGAQVIHCEEFDNRGTLWYRTCEGAAELHALTNEGVGVKCLKSPITQPTPEVPDLWG